MEDLGIKNLRNADANISTIPVREETMSLGKLANTFRKLVTTAGTTFDAGLNSLSQNAGISAIAKTTEVGKSGDDYHSTEGRSEDNNPSSHSAGRRDTRDDAGQYDNRDDLTPRHKDGHGSDTRDTRDTGSNEKYDDGSSHNTSSNEQAPRDKDNSNNLSQSDNTNEQSTSKSDNESAKGQSQQDIDSSSVNRGTANSSSASAQQAATAGANAGINVGNSILGAATKAEVGKNAGINVGNSILGAATKAEVGKNDGTAQEGPNAKLADEGPITTNTRTKNQGAQANTHMRPKANTANANQNTLAQSQSEANIQASNTAQQQAQKIAKSLNPNDTVKVNVTVDTASDTLISKPNSNLIAGTILSGAGGKSTNQTGQQNSNGQAVNGQAPSVAAVAQQVLAAQAQNQGQQNNNQNNHAQAQPSSVSNTASSAQATQVSGAALPSGGETTAGVAGTTTNNGSQLTQTTQQAQDSQANQKPVLKSSVIDQVSVKISKALQAGNDKISIQLKPAELGRVDVKMELTHDGRIMAVVTADNKDTLDLLRKDSNDLQKALENAGLQMGSGDMTFNLRGEENAMANNGDQNSDRSIDDNTTNTDLDNLILAQDIDVISDTRVDVRA
jgi:flagellar hook-length control protein FliK